jgi:hypothetical protein
LMLGHTRSQTGATDGHGVAGVEEVHDAGSVVSMV